MRKNFTSRLAALAAVCLLASAQHAFAWLDAGHSIVAMIAWEDLTPKTKAAVTEALKGHPRYEKDLLLDLPEGSTGEQVDRYAFAKAATWPDMVRLKENPMNAAFSHPLWHFIDIDYVLDDQPVPPKKEPKEKGPQNILEAMDKNLGDLKNPDASAQDKALAVCWIEHLVGDIHQPLHASTLISKQFPEGDAGGNNQVVVRDPPYQDSKMKLHLLWDSLPGDFASPELDSYEAMGLRTDPNFSRDKLKDQLAVNDFKAWVDETHALAVKYAYLDGKLKTATTKEANASVRATVPFVPKGYIRASEHVAMKQLALAGYRLADLLNRTYDPQNAPPVPTTQP